MTTSKKDTSKKEQKLEMTQEQFQQAMKEVAEDAVAKALDQREEAESMLDSEGEMKRTVRVKLVGKVPVKSVGAAYNVRDKANPSGDPITMIDVTTIDDKVHKMTLKEYMMGLEVIVCELVERKEKAYVKSTEKTTVSPRSSDGYALIEGGGAGIPMTLKVKAVDTTYVIKLPNGEIVEVLTAN